MFHILNVGQVAGSCSSFIRLNVLIYVLHCLAEHVLADLALVYTVSTNEINSKYNQQKLISQIQRFVNLENSISDCDIEQSNFSEINTGQYTLCEAIGSSGVMAKVFYRFCLAKVWTRWW